MTESGKVKEFEDLRVFQEARKLTTEIYTITKSPEFRRDRELISQIRRAAVSVMSNIAEGFERNGNREFIQFLYVAKGSCGEVRGQLIVAYDQKYVDKETAARIGKQCKLVSAMLKKLIDYLESSSFKGVKSSSKKS